MQGTGNLGAVLPAAAPALTHPQRLLAAAAHHALQPRQPKAIHNVAGEAKGHQLGGVEEAALRGRGAGGGRSNKVKLQTIALDQKGHLVTSCSLPSGPCMLTNQCPFYQPAHLLKRDAQVDVHRVGGVRVQQDVLRR